MKNTFNTLLLLSNSITLRRDKSILYSTGTLFKTIIRVPLLLLAYSATFLYTNIRLLNNELTDFKAESLICENNTLAKRFIFIFLLALVHYTSKSVFDADFS